MIAAIARFVLIAAEVALLVIAANTPKRKKRTFRQVSFGWEY